MNQPSNKLELRIGKASKPKNHYEKFNIDPSEWLIFTTGAFNNSYPTSLAVIGKNQDVKNFELFLEKTREIPGVLDAVDLNHNDPETAHKNYIFALKFDSPLNDLRIIRDVEKLGRDHNIDNLKYLMPRGMQMHEFGPTA